MGRELEIFAIRLGMTLLAAPLMGLLIMIGAEKFEKAWKTSNRRKKWLASCGVFLFLAGISGWLQ